MALFDTIGMIFERSGLKSFLADGGWKTLIMFAIVGVLVYLAIVKKFEPLLLLPIAFWHAADKYTRCQSVPYGSVFGKSDQHPTDRDRGRYAGFSVSRCEAWHLPAADLSRRRRDDGFLAADCNPKTLFLGAAVQFGVFVAFIGALLLGFTVPEAASIGIIGGADGRPQFW